MTLLQKLVCGVNKMIRYLLVLNGQIRFCFFNNEIDELVTAYYNYKKHYSDVLAFEIGYSPED